MTDSLPATAVLRVSRVTFGPSRFAEVDALNTKQAEYLIPAIKQLPGLIHWYSGLTQDGFVQISVWDSDEHAAQMDHLKEMAVVARGEMTAIGGLTFHPIVNYPITWTI
jgi:hypothetical protein